MIRKLRMAALMLTIAFLAPLAVSCASANRSMCERDHTYKSGSNLRNRSHYSVRYGFKSKPVKKDYVIQNKRTGKRY